VYVTPIGSRKPIRSQTIQPADVETTDLITATPNWNPWAPPTVNRKGRVVPRADVLCPTGTQVQSTQIYFQIAPVGPTLNFSLDGLANRSAPVPPVCAPGQIP